MAKVNYTVEQVAQITQAYEGGMSVEDIAILEGIGKTVRSVISKLVHEGVYITPEKPKAAKRDEGPTKGELITEIADKFAFSKEGLAGLAGATKAALVDILVQVAVTEPEVEDEAEVA